MKASSCVGHRSSRDGHFGVANPCSDIIDLASIFWILAGLIDEHGQGQLEFRPEFNLNGSGIIGNGVRALLEGLGTFSDSWLQAVKIRVQRADINHARINQEVLRRTRFLGSKMMLATNQPSRPPLLVLPAQAQFYEFADALACPSRAIALAETFSSAAQKKSKSLAASCQFQSSCSNLSALTNANLTMLDLVLLSPHAHPRF
jgi:hypothetical protein